MGLGVACALSRLDMREGDASRSLRNALLINLDASLKTGLLNTVNDGAATDTIGDAVDRLARHRRALTEVHTLAVASQVDGRSLALISGALARADAELQILIASQMYRLYISNSQLAEAARKAEMLFSDRERRWGRLAAATVIPLLFLSLLGTNTLPKQLLGFSLEGPWSFIAVTIITAALAALGFAWADYNREMDG